MAYESPGNSDAMPAGRLWARGRPKRSAQQQVWLLRVEKQSMLVGGHAWEQNRAGPQGPVKIAEAAGKYAERASDMAMRSMEPPQGNDWRRGLRGNNPQFRLAVIGAGVIGDPELVGESIALMEVEQVARVAGEAFLMITGVDLSYSSYVGTRKRHSV